MRARSNMQFSGRAMRRPARRKRTNGHAAPVARTRRRITVRCNCVLGVMGRVISEGQDAKLSVAHLAPSSAPTSQTLVAAVSRAYWANRLASRPVTCLMSFVIPLAWSSRK
jgi:hypothetical protein